MEEKQFWISSVGSSTPIWKMCDDSVFVRTSCILTAAVLRYRVDGSLWWDDIDIRLTKDFVEKNETFQIGFNHTGGDGDYDEHVLTVHKGVVYQSFYGQTEWDVRPLLMDVFFKKNKTSLSAKSVTSIVGFDMQSPELDEVDDFLDYVLYVPKKKKERVERMGR